ncbi:MAG: precorrin-2 C(20)-methyltransferase [bacterium]|nr:precorrin-2 C(20)-methyltransferase [bacterium]
MIGKLYCLGVGPGDPELLTLKAVRILECVPCICVPKGKEEGSSLALSIVRKALNLDNKEIIEAYFPMRKTKAEFRGQKGQKGQKAEAEILHSKFRILNFWDETVENILSRLNNGMDVAFITIGDPAIYSTFFYLYDRLLELAPDLNIEIIPGVSSITAAASRAKMALALADERIAILPANYINSLEETLELFDTVVLMKVHNVFDSILKILDSKQLLDRAVYISRAGMNDERIFKNIRDVQKKDLNYFSMVVIKK